MWIKTCFPIFRKHSERFTFPNLFCLLGLPNQVPSSVWQDSPMELQVDILLVCCPRESMERDEGL